MLSGIEAGDDRIDDSRRPVHNFQGRVEAMVASLARRDHPGWNNVEHYVNNTTSVAPRDYRAACGVPVRAGRRIYENLLVQGRRRA